MSIIQNILKEGHICAKVYIQFSDKGDGTIATQNNLNGIKTFMLCEIIQKQKIMQFESIYAMSFKFYFLF